MSKPHPALLTFGETTLRDFPLIMVVGREPNSDEGVVYGIGPYDFREHPGCSFWNVSYSIAGATVGLPTGHLKALCVARRASPLVYADALPITIPNEVKDKRPLRLAVSDRAINDHIEHVFSHEEIVCRIALVVISGLKDSSFARSVDAYRAACQARDLPVAEVPFFYGTNAPEIRRQLGIENMMRLRAVMEQFRQPAVAMVASA